MNKNSKFSHLLRYEGKLIVITFILILIMGCLTWKSFFRTPPQSEIRRDYLIEDISSHSIIHAERLEKFSAVELEIISRLDLNGLLALEKYPAATVRIYHELKDFRLFYDLVTEFGPQHVIPVLDYFYDEGNLSLSLEAEISRFIAYVLDDPIVDDTLSVRQKRLLAILNEINEQQHIFLARFIYTGDGAERNYVSSTTSSLVIFFTGGLSRFNAAVVTKGISGVTTEELVDAGIDILVLIPFAAYFTRTSKTVLRTAKGGRIVTAGKGVSKTSRLAKISSASKGVWRAIPLRTLFKFKYVKWYLLGLVVIKPSLLNHAATLVAEAVSIPPIVMKTSFWFLILFPILNLLTPLFLFLRRLWRAFTGAGQTVS